MKVICPKCRKTGSLREYPTKLGWYNWYVHHGKGERCTILYGALRSLHYYKMMAKENKLEETLQHIPLRWHETFKELFSVVLEG